MTYETQQWPYLQARDFKKVTGRKVRLLVIHTAEIPEIETSAEAIARYFLKPDKPSSCHITVDSDSIVQSVKDSNVAYGAPGANSDGIQIELACYMGQTRSQWIDKYSLAMLALAADATAQYCLKYNLPPVQLSDAQLLAGKSGIVGHDQVSRVYKESDHEDPGPNFPWAYFIAQVRELVLLRTMP